MDWNWIKDLERRRKKSKIDGEEQKHTVEHQVIKKLYANELGKQRNKNGQKDFRLRRADEKKVHSATTNTYHNYCCAEMLGRSEMPDAAAARFAANKLFGCDAKNRFSPIFSLR